MFVNEIDRRMSDWRTTQMRQKFPDRLTKLAKCLDAIKLQLDPEYSVLDVGCGFGFVYKYLGHRNYHGIDRSAEEIAQAKATFPGGSFEQRDLFDIKGQWDVVICSRVLMHIAPLGKAMEILLKAAKKRLFIITHVGAQDGVDETVKDDARFYFRTISPATLGAFGKCSITTYDKYSLVIYDH